MNAALSPPQPDPGWRKALPELTRRFAATAAGHDRAGTFPHDNFKALHEQGLTGLVVPKALGGNGGGLLEASEVISAVARGEPATALVLTMTYRQHRSLARADSRWPAAARDAVLKSGVAHGALINELRVEPKLGTPTRGGMPETVARRTPTGWRISGHKLYNTGIPALRWLVVWGRTDETPPRIGNFLIPNPDAPRHAPGVRVVETWDHLGLRASASHDVIFENVEIPFDHAVDLRAPADWASPPPEAAAGQADSQAWMSVLIGAIYDGIARNARDWLLDFLNTRAPSNLGATLATLPRAQEAVGEIEGLLLTNRRLLEQTARDVDAGRIVPSTESTLVKHLTTNNAVRVVEKALSLTSNHGLTKHNPLERHYRDVLCGRVHAPQDDAILVNAGKAALSLSAPSAHNTGKALNPVRNEKAIEETAA
jgi:alkylation response protein AidB-like acyl-CoA dehydrogenase